VKKVYDKRSTVFNSLLMEKWGYKRDEETPLESPLAEEEVSEETIEKLDEMPLAAEDAGMEEKKKEVEELAAVAIKSIQTLVAAIDASLNPDAPTTVATMSDISENLTKDIFNKEVKRLLTKGETKMKKKTEKEIFKEAIRMMKQVTVQQSFKDADNRTSLIERMSEGTKKDASGRIAEGLLGTDDTLNEQEYPEGYPAIETDYPDLEVSDQTWGTEVGEMPHDECEELDDMTDLEAQQSGAWVKKAMCGMSKRKRDAFKEELKKRFLSGETPEEIQRTMYRKPWIHSPAKTKPGLRRKPSDGQANSVNGRSFLGSTKIEPTDWEPIREMIRKEIKEALKKRSE